MAPFAFCIVEDDWETVARTLAQLHVALDDGLEHQFLEVALHLVVNLVGKAEAAVVHRKQETFYLEFRIQLALDDLDGVEQFADTFQCKVFTLHWDDHAVGCGKRVHCDETQRWGTVDEDIIVFFADRVAADFLITFSRFLRLSISISAPTKVDVARDDVESVDVGSVDGITHICMVDDALIE